MSGDRVSLDLDHCDRRSYADVILDTVLPSLVQKPVRVRAFVFQEAISVLVPTLCHPTIGGLDRSPQIVDERPISGALRIRGRDDEIQERAVDAAVIGEIPVRQLLPGFGVEAMLMQDLSRFLFGA